MQKTTTPYVSMKYLVLARRYRPQLFRDVIGQEAALKTLKNALSHKRVAHAYLFCGSRGIGKTTLARLFAKALNCQALTPDFEPCNLCPSCVEILAGQSFDVIEIDGASNRGIDDIRSLNETVGYAPSHGKYKIYIIDEVHMLTKEAFNALLKTLEEPPERAKFFFATTEPHKVLPTILSRCQRFDLQRLSEEQIAGKLQVIARDLEREAAPEALYRIAQFAEGSLRDAESLFDQILCFADGAVLLEHVQNVLGLVPDEFFTSFDRAFAEGRIAFAFEIVEKLFQMGKDLSHFTEQLVGHYRRLTALRLSPEMHHGPEHESRRLAESAKLYTQAQLCFILDTLLNAMGQIQKSPMQRVSLEALLLKILRSKQRIPLEVLARRLSELEEKLLAAAKSSDAPPPPAPFTPPPQPQPEAPRSIEKLNEKKAGEIALEPVPFNPHAMQAKVEAPTLPPNPIYHPQPQALHSGVKTPGIDDRQRGSSADATHPLANDSLALNSKCEAEKHIQTSPPQENGPAPVHMETLLRFAAVELEGTIQLEK